MRFFAHLAALVAASAAGLLGIHGTSKKTSHATGLAAVGNAAGTAAGALPAKGGSTVITARFYTLPGEPEWQTYTDSGQQLTTIAQAFRLTITKEGKRYRLRVVQTGDETGRGPAIPPHTVVQGAYGGKVIVNTLPDRYLTPAEVALLTADLADLASKRKKLPKEQKLDPNDVNVQVHAALSFDGIEVDQLFDDSAYAMATPYDGSSPLDSEARVIQLLGSMWAADPTDPKKTFPETGPQGPEGTWYDIPDSSNAAGAGLERFADMYDPPSAPSKTKGISGALGN